MEPKEKLTILHDHYKDTISYLKKDIELRDKITIYLFLSLMVYCLIEFQQIDSSSILNELSKKYIGALLSINYSFVTTIILFLILAFTIKYFQICMNIERQYKYIHKIETDLNTILEQSLITREGFSYLNEYPLLNAFISRIYTFFLPILLIGLMLVKLYYIVIGLIVLINTLRIEKHYIDIFITVLTSTSLLNLLISFSIILTTILYLLFIHRDISWVNKSNKILKKIFVLLHLYKED